MFLDNVLCEVVGLKFLKSTNFSITGTVVALKEITRSEEEGTPFTAIREGKSKFKCFN